MIRVSWNGLKRATEIETCMPSGRMREKGSMG
jgi:hypothetical protein